MSKKGFWNAEKIVSGAAILISLLTLVVFIYQTNLMRKQQYLSVMPYLSVGNYHMGLADYAILLENDGIGPAFIESTKITYNGKTYETDFPSFLSQMIPAFDSIPNILYSNIRPGRMIPPGEEIKVLEVGNSQESALQLLMLLDTLEYDFELVYSSIYKERWKLTNEQTQPVKL